ncbi:MAG: cyclic nucleotide-binding domain-containing protein [Nitrospinae bacterium]|nr:cyclic nucleotide-binding domain-containing protein [Nitrospinota bacterium]
MKKVMRFGEYLIERGVVQEKELTEGLALQKTDCQKEEAIAEKLGILSSSECMEINTAREGTGVSFLNMAQELCYINEKEKRTIIDTHNKQKKQIGDLLVQLGYTTKEVVVAELKRFRSLVKGFQEIKDDLKMMRIFNALEDNILYHLSYLPEKITYTAGQTIVKEGAQPDSFYCVLSGDVSIEKNIDSEHKADVAHIRQFDVFGEAAIIGESYRTATAIAQSEAVLYKFNKDDFHRFLRTHAKASYNILMFIANSLLEKLSITDKELGREKISHNT